MTNPKTENRNPKRFLSVLAVYLGMAADRIAVALSPDGVDGWARFGRVGFETRDAHAPVAAKERRVMQVTEVRIVTGDNGKKHLVGYAAPFNQPSLPLTTSKGVRFIEKIAPGAFSDAIRSNPDIPMLHSHDTKKVLARTGMKTLTLSEDDKGLAFDGTLADTTMANDLAADVEHGNIRGMSFGFDNPEDEWSKGDDGMPVRTLRKIPLGEISVTPFPAYPESCVDVRSIDEALAKLQGEPAPDSRDAQPALPERRAIVLCQDQSIQYYCSWGVDSVRYAYDTVQQIIGCLSQYKPEQLEDADKAALGDFLVQAKLLDDKLGQLGVAVSAISGVGATVEGGDPTANPPAEVVAGSGGEVRSKTDSAAKNQQNGNGADSLARLMRLQRMAESGLRVSEQLKTPGPVAEKRDGHMTHAGPVAVHAVGVRCAESMIESGDVIDSDDEDWEWSDDDQERSAQAGGNAHLAIRTDVPVGKDQFTYPCMRNGNLHMEALRSVCREAGKNGADNVAATATDLLNKAKAKRDDMEDSAGND